MAIVDMQKVRLLIHRKDAREALAAIHEIGLVEFTPLSGIDNVQQNEKTLFEHDYISSRVDFAVSFLSQYIVSKKRFRDILAGDTFVVSREEQQRIADTFKADPIIDELQEREKNINHAQIRITELEDMRTLLKPWFSITVPLQKTFDTKHTKTFFLLCDAAIESDLRAYLNDTNVVAGIERVAPHACTVTVFNKDEEVLKKYIAGSDAEEVLLPETELAPKEMYTKLEVEIKELQKYLVQEIREVKKFAPALPKLKVLSDVLRWRKERHDAITGAMSAGSVLVFEGWVPEKKRAVLESAIEKRTALFSLVLLEKDAGEVPPVEIENNALIAPFESVTRLYGLPGSSDLDPTVFLAGFFLLFFGLCLTDVGYGLFVAVLTALVVIVFRLPKETKQLLLLLCFGGLSAAIIGLLFGGYLGVDMGLMPQWAQRIQQFDPIAQPLPVLFLALGLGVVQIMFGIMLKIVRDSKQGELLDGILDNGPWLALFTSLLLLLASSFGFGVESKVAVWMIYGSLALLVLTQGRREKNIGAKAFKGVMSLYDSVGYFSDILSYSRILALGLATTALAFAVNLIAGLVSEMVPYVGGVLMVLILIIGHIFNVAVNVLGAFVHSARLQFVEFFGKFITASGRQFKPFRQSGRYSHVE